MIRTPPAMLFVVSLVAIGCGKPSTNGQGGASDQERTTDVKEVVAIRDRIKAAGGRAERDYNSPEWQFNVKLPERPISEELWADIRRLPGIGDLDLHGESVTDETLEKVSNLRAFESLSLVDVTKVTSVGFRHIGKLKQLNSFMAIRTALSEDAMSAIAQLDHLTHLTISECELPPSGLQKLKGHNELEWLHVEDTGRLTSDGLRSLKTLPRLRSLELTGTKITDDGLVEFKGCDSLSKLDLAGSPLTGTGFVHLSELPHLEHLGLKRTKVTDSNLRTIAGFKKLSWLELDDTGISDTGLRELKQLATLEHLFGTNSKMTLEGYRELHKALPKCAIRDERWVIELLDTIR